MSERPLRLRRQPTGRTEDRLRHVSGLPTAGHTLAGEIHPSPQSEIQAEGPEVVVPSHPGAGLGSITARYNDVAEQANPSHPPAHPGGPPFVLER